MKKSAQTTIHISVPNQELILRIGRKNVASYPVSTSRFGLGTREGSFRTPTGRFRIAERIGDGMPVGTVFKGRQPAKVSTAALRTQDLVMTRILWLDGVDPENANTYDRFIYIHGTNHEEAIGEPVSHGCIRMRNADLVDLFERVDRDTLVVIKA